MMVVMTASGTLLRPNIKEVTVSTEDEETASFTYTTAPTLERDLAQVKKRRPAATAH
jgi:hypothetical protein